MRSNFALVFGSIFDRFWGPFGHHFEAMLGIMLGIGDIAKIIKNLQVFNEFSWFGGSKLKSFSYVFGVSVSRSFFDRLGVGFGVDFGSILALKSDPNRPKNGIEFWIDFRCHAWRKLPTIPGPGTPWGAPQFQRLFEQETTV